MILVDTSVFIDYLKGQNNDSTKRFEYILESKIPYGINDYIYQEILQGSRDLKEFSILKDYFETIPFYYLQNGKESYEKASMINILCKKNGITIRSTIDLLIAETAIENNLYLLHNDNDFKFMSKVVKNLKLYEERLYWKLRITKVSTWECYVTLLANRAWSAARSATFNAFQVKQMLGWPFGRRSKER